MTNSVNRWLAALLIGACLMAAPAHAQGPNDAELIPTPEAEGDSGPDPVYGYVVCSLLAALGVFAVCKSARR
jgi:hypothetical protein